MVFHPKEDTRISGDQPSNLSAASNVLPTESCMPGDDTPGKAVLSTSVDHVVMNVYGMEQGSFPLFTIKCGEDIIPVIGDGDDYHVEDLHSAFQDPLFVRNVVNYAKI